MTRLTSAARHALTLGSFAAMIGIAACSAAPGGESTEPTESTEQAFSNPIAKLPDCDTNYARASATRER